VAVVIERSLAGPLFYWALSLQVKRTGRVDLKVVFALLKGHQQFLQQNPDPRCLGRVLCGIHPQVGGACDELLQGSWQSWSISREMEAVVSGGITGTTLTQRLKWVEASSPSDRLSELHHP